MAVSLSQREEAPSTVIARVRFKSHTGEVQLQEFEPSALYIVTDENPYLELEVTGHALKSAELSEQNDGELIKAGTDGWSRWSLGRQLSADRRMGQFEMALKVPKQTVLKCYVVPTKLLSIRDVWSMITLIEAELDVSVAWDPELKRRIRSWALSTQWVNRPLTMLLLDLISEELSASQSLRRSPPMEPGRRGKNLEPAPEMSLVSQWAIRRARRLAQTEERLVSELLEQQLRLREAMPVKRQIAIATAKDQTGSLLANVRMLRARVLNQVISDELACPIAFGLLAQRDLRFRRLLRAFAPTNSDIASERVSQWSQLPPISLNRLFECWGAVWIIHELRRLGFHGVADRTIGADLISSGTWTLRRGEVQVTLDYEAHPAQLQFKDAPSIEDREDSLDAWAASRQYTDEGRSIFGSNEQCSPDYVLRFNGPGGHALAVGDACLADPAYHHDPDKSKVNDVKSYRQSIIWYRHSRVQRCDPLGGFVLFPGPTEKWTELARKVCTSDVWIICPKACSVDTHAQQRFEKFLEKLVARVK